MMDQAKNSLEGGAEYPYDAPDNWDRSVTPSLPATDWAHAAARGILYNLNDRRDIKDGFRDVDEDVRKEIVESLAAIIREAAKKEGE